jgi:hypothetical protein
VGNVILVNPRLLAQWVPRPNATATLRIVALTEDGSAKYTVLAVQARDDGYALLCDGREVCQVDEEWICSQCKTRRCEHSQCLRAALPHS